MKLHQPVQNTTNQNFSLNLDGIEDSKSMMLARSSTFSELVGRPSRRPLASEPEKVLELHFPRWNARDDVRWAHQCIDSAMGNFPTWLMRAAKELINNSNDSIVHAHKDPYGEIRFRISLGSERCRLKIEDSGAGINQSIEPFLFRQRLSPLDMSDLHLPDHLAKGNWPVDERPLIRGGKGLALITMAEYLANLDGEFGYQNKGVGMGAIFWIELPTRNLTEVLPGSFSGG